MSAQDGGGDGDPQKGELAQAGDLIDMVRQRLTDADADLASLNETTNAASTRLAEISEVATQAAAAKAAIADAQAVIAAKSAHIEDAKIHADKVRADLDTAKTTATQHATEAEGLRARAQTASDSAVELLASTRSQKAAVDTELAAVIDARDEAKAAAVVTRELADKAETIEQRIALYEKRLEELDALSDAQLQTITGLLPGATAAGLASAFDKRRETFLDPSTRWQWIFVAALVLLIALAGSGLWQVYGHTGDLTWDALARLWVARLPIAAALVWLALYASRESALAKRLEEDYGYKAAIASSFQGFQKEMAEIAAGIPVGSPLAKLCTDTLTTIGNSPGRIYDKHELILSPAHELSKAARELAKAAGSLVRPGEEKKEA